MSEHVRFSTTLHILFTLSSEIGNWSKVCSSSFNTVFKIVAYNVHRKLDFTCYLYNSIKFILYLKNTRYIHFLLFAVNLLIFDLYFQILYHYTVSFGTCPLPIKRYLEQQHIYLQYSKQKIHMWYICTLHILEEIFCWYTSGQCNYLNIF